MVTPITPFPEIQVEFTALADDLVLHFLAGFYEDEKAETPAKSIVYSGETYYVQFEWWLTGKLAHHFCGKWCVKVDLESIGTAPEFSLPCECVDMDPCKTDHYIKIFKITPDTVRPDPCGTVYLVSATLSSEDPCGRPGHLWAYGTGVSVMFVQGTPDVQETPELS